MERCRSRAEVRVWTERFVHCGYAMAVTGRFGAFGIPTSLGELGDESESSNQQDGHYALFHTTVQLDEIPHGFTVVHDAD